MPPRWQAASVLRFGTKRPMAGDPRRVTRIDKQSVTQITGTKYELGLRRDRPGAHPAGGDPAGQALPVGGRLRPARRGMPGAPHQPQGQGRQDQRHELRAPVRISPLDLHSPMGLDADPQPGRHHRGQVPTRPGPAQPRTTRPDGVTRPANRPRGTTGFSAAVAEPVVAAIVRTTAKGRGTWHDERHEAVKSPSVSCRKSRRLHIGTACP